MIPVFLISEQQSEEWRSIFTVDFLKWSYKHNIAPNFYLEDIVNVNNMDGLMYDGKCIRITYRCGTHYADEARSYLEKLAIIEELKKEVEK